MLNDNPELGKELIQRLKTASEDAIILVEGKKDKFALKKLGIVSEIFLLNSNKSLVENSEKLAKKQRRVILLLDTDKKGQELTKKMKNHLQAQGVRFDTKLGKRLLRATNSRTIESIARIFEGLD